MTKQKKPWRTLAEKCPACGLPLRPTTITDDWGSREKDAEKSWAFIIKVRRCHNPECPAKPATELFGTLRLTAAGNILGFLVDALLRIDEFMVKAPADMLAEAIRAVEAKDVTPKEVTH